jgi:hypothetical protein
MAQWKELKSYSPMTFEKLYKKLANEFKRQNLSLNGFSLNHTLTIASIFKFTPQQTITLIGAYHGDANDNQTENSNLSRI